MKQQQLIIWLKRDLVEGDSVDEFTVDKECPFIKINCQENSLEMGLSSKWLILTLIVMLIQGPMVMWMIILSQTIKITSSITILLMIAANTNDNRNYTPTLIIMLVLMITLILILKLKVIIC